MYANTYPLLNKYCLSLYNISPNYCQCIIYVDTCLYRYVFLGKFEMFNYQSQFYAHWFKIDYRVVISQAFINITKVKYSNMVDIQDVPRTYPENEHV